jgi:hypothetical protein
MSQASMARPGMAPRSGDTVAEPERAAAQAEGRPSPLRPAAGLWVVLAVVAADGCLYHGGGYAGWAVFVAVLVAVLCAGSGRCWQTGRRVIAGLLLTGLVLTVLRLSWQGNLPLIVAAVIQLFALAIALRGGVPFLPRVAQDVALALPRGCLLAPWLVRGNRGALRLFAWVSPVRVWLPALVTVSFAALFVLANPHWTERIAEVFRSGGDWAIAWLRQFSLGQVVLWLVVAGAVLGLLGKSVVAAKQNWSAPEQAAERVAASPWYEAVRNMLICVNLLFFVYLIFEFYTMWFRQFPDGFYYAGYAHRGAFWLTVALAWTTLVLGLAFRGSLMADPRLLRLRRWAVLWSVCNGLLAAAAYNRLWIYIEYNGLTRLRIVGLYGITCVLVGFVLVLYKIYSRRSFYWLIHSQLWALALALLCLALTPLDWLAHRHNVRRVLAGDPAPAVQVAYQPLSAEGYLAIMPLLRAEDPVIRSGVRALLARWQWERERSGRADTHWSDFQLAPRRLARQLRAWEDASLDDAVVSTPAEAQTLIDRMAEYTYRWY